MSFIGDVGSFILGAAYELRVPLAIAGIASLVILAIVARRRRWGTVARRHPAASAVLLVAALAIGGPVGWYLVSPVFLKTELQEPPVALGAQDTPAPSVVVTPPPATDAPSRPSSPPAGQPTPSAQPTPGAQPTPTPGPAVRTGTFAGTDEFHFGRGKATLLQIAPGEWTLRFDGFSVRNGPDLYVYLSPDPAGYVDGAIEVGRLRATDGSFNTPIPPGTEVSGVRSVLIWCKQFSHLFAVATLDG